MKSRRLALGPLALVPLLLAATAGGPGQGAMDPAARQTEDSPFITSDTCALCHTAVPTASALVTATGADASPHGQWKATAMANSARDPYFRAQLARELERHPEQAEQAQDLCLKCHAPMAHHGATATGGDLPRLATLDGDPHAMDGVSCSVCHQIAAEGLGDPSTFSGNPPLALDGRIFGPYEEPMTSAMRMHSGYTPTHGPHVSDSAACGACHTLFTHPGPDGEPFLEQAPYLEWLASDYSKPGGEGCVDCHMPDQGRMRIAHNPAGRDFHIEPRDGVKGHAFVGGNAFLLELLAANRERLGVRASEEDLLTMAAATRAQLAHSTARIAIENPRLEEGSLVFETRVENLVGHKLPSAYPSRRVWWHVGVELDGVQVFESGAIDGEGRIQGIQDPLEVPHRDVVDGPGQAVIYELVAEDSAGRATTSLLDMAVVRKDSRLLPKGWDRDHEWGERTAPVGTDGDDSFTGGGDRVTWEVPVPEGGASSIFVLAELYYQPIPPAWVDALRGVEAREARDFVEMADELGIRTEVIASVAVSLH